MGRHSVERRTIGVFIADVCWLAWCALDDLCGRLAGRCPGDVGDAGFLAEEYERPHPGESAADRIVDTVVAAIPDGEVDDAARKLFGDVNPDTAPAELEPSTLSAEQAVDAIHTDHPYLPRNLPWKLLDDGAQLCLDAIGATHSDEELRSLVATYAAVLTSQVAECPREPAEQGYTRVWTAGVYRGTRVVVEAVVSPDPDAAVERVYRQFRAEDDTQAFAPIVVEEAMSA